MVATQSAGVRSFSVSWKTAAPPSLEVELSEVSLVLAKARMSSRATTETPAAPETSVPGAAPELSISATALPAILLEATAKPIDLPSAPFSAEAAETVEFDSVAFSSSAESASTETAPVASMSALVTSARAEE